VTAIHFVERTDNVRKTDRNRNEWESGCWPVSEETAQKLIGGTIYLHRSKQQPSHFGGEILSYRVEPSDTQAPCVVFTLRADADCKGIKTDRKGWSKDLKIFWDAAQPAHV
jgi:hypothetical protein